MRKPDSQRQKRSLRAYKIVVKASPWKIVTLTAGVIA